MATKTERKILTQFEAQPLFTRQDLLEYFLKEDQDLNPNTFIWRIHDLKKKGIIKEVKRGWYTVGEKPVFTHTVDDQLRKISKLIKESYNNARYCVWNVNWLNEFTVHQFTNYCDIIETEKDLTNSLPPFLYDRGYRTVLTPAAIRLKPAYKMDHQIMIEPLITRAPLQEVDLGRGVTAFIPTLEKMLVDIFNDDNLFHFVQGSEMIRIFENALFRYTINFTTLFSYAERRNKSEAIKDFLLNHNLIKSDFA